jgi:hypothetical protein
MTGAIDYTAVWGGRLKNHEQMLVFESVSIILQLVLVVALFVKQQLLPLPVSMKVVNGILWFYLVVFTLNTFGNLAAINIWERIIGTLATLVVVFMLWKILSDSKFKT